MTFAYSLMVERLEREALVEYQLAVHAAIAGAKVTPVTVDEARADFDARLNAEPAPLAPADADRDELHRILGVA